MTLFNDTQKLFEEARKIYPGTKRGFDTEYKNFQKHKDYEVCVTKLTEAIQRQTKHKEVSKQKKEFVPNWKHFERWIKYRCWEEELPEIKTAPVKTYEQVTVTEKPEINFFETEDFKKLRNSLRMNAPKIKGEIKKEPREKMTPEDYARAKREYLKEIGE